MSQLGALDLLTGGGAASAYPGTSVTLPQMINLGQAIPGIGPQGGMISQMFLQPLLQGMLGDQFAPGQFAPSGNLFDFYRRQQQFSSMQRAIYAAGEVDQNTYMQYARGAAGMMGLRFTDERARAARVMAQDISAVTPLLSQVAPELVDRLHGSRGSAQVMAQSLFMGGRYMLDPITGRQGLSADTISNLTARTSSLMFGPGSDPSQFGGLSAGRIGIMVDELARRGQLYPAMRREQMLREVATKDVQNRIPGLSGDALEREIGETMGRMEKLGGENLRNFQADRVLTRVKDLSKVVGAMEDIFGALGKPNAPMAEILTGLQSLTQGGLNNLQGGQMEGLVRGFSILARRTGIGMDNGAALVVAAGQRAEQFGVHRAFGAQAALGAMAFGQAFGVNQGGLISFHAPTKEQMQALDARLRIGASASNDFNQMAALLRMSDMGLVNAAPGSQMAAMIGALRSGRSEYSFGGRTMSTYMRPGDFVNFATGQGVDGRMLQTFIGQTKANEETGFKYGLQDVSRDNQAVQARMLVRDTYMNLASTFGVRKDSTIRAIGDIAASGLLDEMTAEDAQDHEKMLSRFKTVLAQKGIRVGPAEEKQLRDIATAGKGAVNQVVANSPNLKGVFGTGEAFLAANRRDNREEYGIIRMEERIESRFQSALSGLGRASPVQRIADAILDAGPGTSAKTILARALGAEPTDKVATALQGPILELQANIEKYQGIDKEVELEASKIRDLQNRISRTPPGQARDAMKRELNGKLKAAGITDVRNMTDRGLRAGLRSQFANGVLDIINKSVTGLDNAARASGINTQTISQIEDIKQAQSLLADGKGRGILEMSELAQSIIHDDKAMEALGPGGLGLIRGILDGTNNIQAAASAAGMTVDDFLRSDKGSRMLTDFRSGSETIRARLANPSKEKISDEERRSILAYNKLRTESPTATMERIRKSMGMASGSLDKYMQSLEKSGAFAGMSGHSLREASMSMEEIRKMAALSLGKKVGDLTEGDLQGYINSLGHGPITDEQSRHLMNITAGTGKMGRGLTGMLGKVNSDTVAAAVGDYRRMSDPGAVAARRMANAMGLDPASIGDVGLGADQSSSLRMLQSADALKRLRSMRKGLDDQASWVKYLSEGPGKDASAEERRLFDTGTRGMSKELVEAMKSGDKDKIASFLKAIGDQTAEDKPLKIQAELKGNLTWNGDPNNIVHLTGLMISGGVAGGASV